MYEAKKAVEEAKKAVEEAINHLLHRIAKPEITSLDASRYAEIVLKLIQIQDQLATQFARRKSIVEGYDHV